MIICFLILYFSSYIATHNIRLYTNDNYDKEEEYKPKPISKNKQKIYNKIEKEQEICRVNKYKHITPDMTKDEIMATKFKNSSIDSSCSSKTTPKYILS